MTIEELKEEIDKLKKQREEMVANLHAIGGAIQFAELMREKMTPKKE